MKIAGIQILSLVLISILLAFTACKRDHIPADRDTGAPADDAFAESVFDDISNMADEAYDMGSNNLKSEDDDPVYLGPCVAVYLDTVADPRQLVIDFGEENCLCKDGKYRRGKILVSFTGRYKKPSSVITTTFDNYYVNNNNVEGAKVVTNMGFDEENHPYFSVEVNGVIHLAGNGGTLSWNAVRTRTWIRGYLTRRIRDDVYLITGSGSGIRPSGFTWEREIVDPLRAEMNCRWIVSGTVEIIPENRPVRTLDFGDGECDNQAVVIINGVSYPVTLH